MSNMDMQARLGLKDDGFSSNIKSAKDRLKELTDQFGVGEKELVNFKKQSKDAEKAWKDLRATYNAMSDDMKNSPFGQAMAKEIEIAKNQVASFKDQIADMGEEIRHLSSDTKFTDSVSAWTGVIGDCSSAVVALGGDTEDFQKVIMKLAQIQTVTKAVEGLTKAFQAQNLVLLKNPYVAVVGAVVALGAALVSLRKNLDEARDSQRLANEVSKRAKDSYIEEETKIKILNERLHDNALSQDERKKALTEIQSMVPEYHGALTKEGELINDNSDSLEAYCDNLIKAAEAQAAFDMIVEKTRSKLQKQQELKKQKSEFERNRKYSGANIPSGVGFFRGSVDMGAASSISSLEREIAKDEAEIQELKTMVTTSSLVSGGKPKGGGSKGGSGKSKTLDDIIAEAVQAYSDELAIIAKKRDDNFYDETNAVKNEIKATEDEVKEIEKLIDVYRNSAKGTSKYDTQINALNAALKDAKNKIKHLDDLDIVKKAEQDYADAVALIDREKSEGWITEKEWTDKLEQAMKNLVNSLNKVSELTPELKQRIGGIAGYFAIKNQTDTLSSEYKGMADLTFQRNAVFGQDMPNGLFKKDAYGKLIEPIVIDHVAELVETIGFIRQEVEDIARSLMSGNFEELLKNSTNPLTKDVADLIKLTMLDGVREAFSIDHEGNKHSTENFKLTVPPASKIKKQANDIFSTGSDPFSTKVREYNDLIEKYSKLQDLYNGYVSSDEYDKLLPYNQQYFTNIFQTDLEKLLEEIKPLAEEIQDELTFQVQIENAEKVAGQLSNLGSSLKQIGNNWKEIDSDFNSKPLNIAGILAQSIANIISGYAAATAEAGGALGPIGWAAFALGGLAEVTGVIAQINALKDNYASGGIVGGGSYHGDKIMAGLNSGEMVLTTAQQSNLFKLLDNGVTSGTRGNVEFKIKGKELVGVLRNYNSQTSKI